jgi:hypothetical protein
LAILANLARPRSDQCRHDSGGNRVSAHKLRLTV